jgi:Uma2 family endonuclease
MPPNKWNHARIVEQLAHLLRAQLDPETVYVVTSVFGLVIRREPLTTRVPDLAVLVASRLVEKDGYIQSAPELIVEVLSVGNTRAERTEKLRDYESLGAPEVWVLSPEAQTVEVLQLKDGRLTTTVLLKEGRLAPQYFPDAGIDIAAIWPI